LYIASTVFVLYLTINEPEPAVWNGLFWVIQLFICVNAVAKSFLSESRGRMLYFYSLVSPVHFIIGKMLYNILLMGLMAVLSLWLFSVFLNNPVISKGLFAGITLLGAFSLSMVFTLMSAIAAKAQNNATMMAILGFPIVITLLLLLLKLSKVAFGEVFRDDAVMQLCLMIGGLDIIIVVMALVLFPYLWKD
jgi:heme exporter protein B